MRHFFFSIFFVVQLPPILSFLRPASLLFVGRAVKKKKKMILILIILIPLSVSVKKRNQLFIFFFVHPPNTRPVSSSSSAAQPPSSSPSSRRREKVSVQGAKSPSRTPSRLPPPDRKSAFPFPFRPAAPVSFNIINQYHSIYVKSSTTQILKFQ